MDRISKQTIFVPPTEFQETFVHMIDTFAGNRMTTYRLRRFPKLAINEKSSQVRAEPIPAAFRSKPITKSAAARLLGQNPNSSGVRWLNHCIEDGTIRCEPLSRQRFVFDIRQFPESTHGLLRPNPR
jgi:hypothetical protein